jgi:hypothetical protein
MGFRREPRKYLLRFEDPDLEGFEIVMKSLSVEEFLKLTGYFTAYQQETGNEAAEALLGMFAKSIDRWNLEDENGAYVPATLEGVQGQELAFIMQILTAWMESMAGVPAPLPDGSNGSAPYPAASLPMEPLSPSHLS